MTTNRRDAARARLTAYIESVQTGTNPAADGVVHRSEILDAVLGPDDEPQEDSATAATNAVRYPDVHVQLTGRDGNAFAIIGAVGKALRRAHGPEAAAEWTHAAMSAESYDALLQLALAWVQVS